jgi:hypothetical protein
MVSAEDDTNGGPLLASKAGAAGWWQDGLACAVLLALCVALSVPSAQIPLGDEFSYAKSAQEFARTGHLVYNGWAATAVGWIAPWGALFIKLFGFSFLALRLSMLLVGMAIVVLFHQVLAGFGIGRRNALLGTLTLGLSPLFMQLSVSFLTDLPGLLFVVVCIVMCQRAAAAATDRATVLWLVSAAAVNVMGGTARQTTWLGALVMVPATAYLLRKRRGVLPAAATALLLSLVSIVLMMHWCGTQPYFIPAKTFPTGARYLITPANLIAQTAKSIACLVLLIAPIAVCWLVRARDWTTRARLTGLAALLVVIGLTLLLVGHGPLSPWLVPWVPFNLVSLGLTDLPLWLRTSISILTVAIAIPLLPMLRDFLKAQKQSTASEQERRAFWIMGPFSAVYILFLVPRGLFSVYDRYLLALVLTAIVWSLLSFERRAREARRSIALPSICTVAIVVYCLFGIASVHDYFGLARGTVDAVEELRLAGVPRTAVTAGFGADGWVQVNLTGHLNDPQVKVPANAHRDVVSWTASDDCSIWDYYLLPDLHPKYIVEDRSSPCVGSSPYAPVVYRTWLPPFERKVFIDTVR